MFSLLAVGMVSAQTTDPTAQLCPFPFVPTTVDIQPCIETVQIAGTSSGTMIANDAITYQEGNNQTNQINSYHSNMVGIGQQQYASQFSFANAEISAQKAIVSGNSVGIEETYAQSNMNYTGYEYNDQSQGGASGAFSGGYASSLTLSGPINSQFTIAMVQEDGSPDSGFGAVWQSVKGVEGVGNQITATQESSTYNAYSGDKFSFAAQINSKIGHPFASSTIGTLAGTLNSSRIPLCGNTVF